MSKNGKKKMGHRLMVKYPQNTLIRIRIEVIYIYNYIHNFLSFTPQSGMINLGIKH